MVSRDIIHFDTAAKHARYLLDHLHVGSRPVFPGKLPDIYNITVQHKYRRIDGRQVTGQFVGAAAICTQVDIGNNNYIQFSFFQ